MHVINRDIVPDSSYGNDITIRLLSLRADCRRWTPYENTNVDGGQRNDASNLDDDFCVYYSKI